MDLWGKYDISSIHGHQYYLILIDDATRFVTVYFMCADHPRTAYASIAERSFAPYSQAQNGVAERMNRTLVELARAMLSAANLPEFLWEPAVAHAAYLRNRAYTSFSRIRCARLDPATRTDKG